MLAGIVTAVLAAALSVAPGQVGHGLPVVEERYFGVTAEVNSLLGSDRVDADGSACPELIGSASGSLGRVSPQQYNQECVFRLARATGMGWATISAFWSVIQPDLREPPDWTDLDQRVTAALCQGVEPVIRTVNAPSQPAGAPGTRVSGAPGAPPRADGEAMPEYREWVRRLAERYGPGGELERALRTGARGCAEGAPPRLWSSPAIVIWNEQNKPGGWGGVDPLLEPVPDCGAPDCDSILHYLRMLRAARSGVSDAGGGVLLVVGGVAAQRADDPNLGPYLDALADRAIPFERQFDVLGVHPYAPWARARPGEHGRDVEALMRTARARLDAAGGPEKPIWILELGWTSCREPYAGYPAACARRDFRARNTDERGQARRLAAAIEVLTSSRDRLGLERLGLWGFADLGSAEQGGGAEQGRGGGADGGADAGVGAEPGTTSWLGRDTPAVCDWCHGSGLWRRDWSPKPAYDAWIDQVLRWRGALD